VLLLSAHASSCLSFHFALSFSFPSLLAALGCCYSLCLSLSIVLCHSCSPHFASRSALFSVSLYCRCLPPKPLIEELKRKYTDQGALSCSRNTDAFH
jgi:hypothetical protein